MTQADSPRARPDVRQLPDLAGRILGGTVVYTNDETFAAAQNLISPGPARHDPAEFDLRGKVYDGAAARQAPTS